MGKTIYQAFAEIAKKFPGKTALLRGRKGPYQRTTYSELKIQVDTLSENIKRLGMAAGDRIGIISFNRPEWVIADLAALRLGCVVVPIYYNLAAPAMTYMLKDSGVRLLFLENTELLSKMESPRKELPWLEHIVLFDHEDVNNGINALRFEDLTRPPTVSIADDGAGSADDIATIVYTSGTTGEPKGVMLTHANILSNVSCAVRRYRVTEGDSIVSYLPLSHMFERTGGYYTILLSGGTIAYARNISTLARDIAETRPSLLIAVPGVLEKAYNEGSRKAQSGSRIRSILISSTITNLNRRTSLRCKMKRVPWSLALRCIILDFLIARRFRKAAGGRLRLIISGGAPLDRRIARIFHILGFTIVEGYGLTETSPVVCSSLLDDNRLGTVGKPFEGVEIKISDNEEILVRGPNVMKGYLNKPEETARVIDQQGWFHTGDQGRWDDGDDLIITGRIKELIVNSFGKKIPPEPIEQRICKSQYIDQALIFGDRQRYPMALIVPNRKAIEGRAQRENIHHHNYASLLNHTRIRELIRREIKSATANLSSYEKPRAFIMTPDHFTVENGLLTSTLKLRRGAVLERYKPEINALFEQIENRHGQGNRGAKKRYGAISSLLN